MNMIINANTKISQLLKQNVSALEAIVSINPKFEKLRNPLLRKVMAPRTTIAAASRMGGCSVDEFFQKLKPLGFEIDSNTGAAEEKKKAFSPFITQLNKEQIIELDVRPVIT